MLVLHYTTRIAPFSNSLEPFSHDSACLSTVDHMTSHVFDDHFAYGKKGNGQYHAPNSTYLSSCQQSKNDQQRMQVKGTAHNLWRNHVPLQHLNDQIDEQNRDDHLLEMANATKIAGIAPRNGPRYGTTLNTATDDANRRGYGKPIQR